MRQSLVIILFVLPVSRCDSCLKESRYLPTVCEKGSHKSSVSPGLQVLVPFLSLIT